MTNSFISVAAANRVLSTPPADLEALMLREPKQAGCPVVHHFAPGIYVRELHMAAGTFAVGHEQLTEHLNIVLAGAVLMSEGQFIEAPAMFVGKPSRKAGYVVRDVVWQNVYSTNVRDVAALEEMLLRKSDTWLASEQAPSPREQDRADYVRVLQDHGYSEQDVWAQSTNVKDQTELPLGTYKFRTARSGIHGTGIVATAGIRMGEAVGPATVGGLRTPLGRYMNHSASPNCAMVEFGTGSYMVVAVNDIRGCRAGFDGDELTVDYRQVLSLKG